MKESRIILTLDRDVVTQGRELAKRKGIELEKLLEEIVSEEIKFKYHLLVEMKDETSNT